MFWEYWAWKKEQSRLVFRSSCYKATWIIHIIGWITNARQFIRYFTSHSQRMFLSCYCASCLAHCIVCESCKVQSQHWQDSNQRLSDLLSDARLLVTLPPVYTFIKWMINRNFNMIREIQMLFFKSGYIGLPQNFFSILINK